MRPIEILVVLMSSIAIVSCSKSASDGVAQANSDSAPARDGACGLLTLGDVRSVLPEASKAVPKDTLAAQGINSCGWYVASGKYPVLEVSVWQVSGADDTPMDNVRTLAMGLADPLSSDGQRSIRFEKMVGVGDDAAAVVERTDPAKGIIGTGAMLTLQKNGRIAMVASSQLASRDRAIALEQLTTLGKAVAQRL